MRGRGVPALFGRGEGAYAFEASVGGEGGAASGQYLVAVGLVAYVPDDAVVRGVEHVMEGDGQFDCSQAGGEVSGVARHFFYDVLP